MDKILLVGRALSSEMILAGELFVEKIEKSPLHLHLAMWFQSSPDDFWRFVLAFPEVRLEGPKTVYKKLRSISNRIPLAEYKIANDYISVIEERDPLVKAFRSAIHVNNGGVRFSHSTINGLFIEDSYIYKLV
jgi:hypothetical protein